MDGEAEEQADGVYDRMTLAPIDLLARVTTPNAAAFGVGAFHPGRFMKLQRVRPSTPWSKPRAKLAKPRR